MIGIMQGRLSPPVGGKLQSFPGITWSSEFVRARAIGLQYIEWVYGADDENENPISHYVGQQGMTLYQSSAGVPIKYLCADWFMNHPLIRASAKELEYRVGRLRWLIDICPKVGITGIVIPFVDNSGMHDLNDLYRVASVIDLVIRDAVIAHVHLYLETNCGPHYTDVLLRRIGNPVVQINYDTGNSASLGFDTEEELSTYGKRIGHIHIKDRKLSGGSVPLGEGNADIEYVIKTMKHMGYAGDYTLQVARSETGGELGWAEKNLSILRGYLESPI